MPPSTSLSWNDSSITSLAARQTVPAAKVLIVDRDPDVVERLRSVVGAAGYPTVGATTATQALALIKSQGCQIVILDREMPEIDGLVLCAAIRAARVLPGYVYIILRSDQAGDLMQIKSGMRHSRSATGCQSWRAGGVSRPRDRLGSQPRR